MRTSVISIICVAALVICSDSAPDRQKVLDYFWHISTINKTITGQANKEPNSDPTYGTRQVYEITGKYPGLWGADFLYSRDDGNHRQTMIDEAKRQWNAGSLVTIMMSVCPPNVGDECPTYPDVQRSLTDTQWNCLTRRGCDLNTRWLRRLDHYATYFKQLQDAGVVVLFRLFHEINGNWFWWTRRPGPNGRDVNRPGPNGSIKLYQLTYDYLKPKLNNIIWVWCVNDLGKKWANGPYANFYPGHNYVDILALDVYDEENKQPTKADYDELLRIGGGKPIALGEVGQMPTPETLKDQPKWTYFLEWVEHLTNSTWNTPESVRRTYNSDRTLKRGEVEVFNW